MCVYVWFTGIANSVVYSVFIPLSKATGLTFNDLKAGTGYLFLLPGWGLLFFQPFALQYDKRLTYLISTAVTVAFTIWGAHAKGNGQWIAKNVLCGFFASPIRHCLRYPSPTSSMLMNVAHTWECMHSF
jgi:hypothetical protein